MKPVLTTALLIVIASFSAAQAASVAKPNSQQNRMKTCAAEYRKKGIPKSGYRKFMSQCLRTHPKKETNKNQQNALPTQRP